MTRFSLSRESFRGSSIGQQFTDRFQHLSRFRIDHACRIVNACLVLLLLLPPPPASAQELTVTRYTTADGLPNNLVKHVLQDDTGFIWISTDAGLVRFDGRNMRTYTVADGLPDNYVKSTFEDSRRRLFVVTDLGVAEIVRTISAIRFVPVLEESATPDDSLMSYPKAIFEDRSHNLWIACARGLVRLSDSGVQPYPMPAESWPVSFVRSYSLVEDNSGHLIAASERGKIYVLHPDGSRFVEISTPEELQQVNAASARPDGSVWVAGSFGIHSFRMMSDHRAADWRIVADQPDIMDIQSVQNNDVLLGTAGHGLLILSVDETTPTVRPYVQTESSIVHDVSVTAEGVFFVATDNGVSLIRRSFFSQALELKSTAIQSTAVSPGGEVFGIADTTLFRVRRGARHSTREPVFSTDEVLTAVATDGIRHWAGSAGGTVYRYSAGNVTPFDLRTDEPVASMTVDGRGNAWVSQFKSSEVIRIGVDGSVRRYGPDKGVHTRVNVVRSLDDKLLVGGDGVRYLLEYRPSEDRFSDISLPVFGPTGSGLVVNDVDLSDDGILWMATNSGLLAYGSGSVRRLEALRELDQVEVRAITHDRFGQMWIGTGTGVHRYSRDQVSNFSQDPGIGNQTVHYRSLVVDADHRVWIGFHGGVSFWNRPPGEVHITPRPVPIEFVVDGVDVDVSGQAVEIPYGAYVEAEFASLSYPGSKVRYATRFGDSPWSQPRRDSHFHIPRSSSGSYLLEIRAQQDGYIWSPPAELTVSVAIPWYQEWWAIGLFVVASVAVIVVMWRVHHHVRTMQLRIHNEQLTQLVEKRTRELQEQKQTVERTNQDLKAALERNHEFLGVAAHDLRNPLTSLIGFSELLVDSLDMLEPHEFVSKGRDVLPIIHRAAATMQGVIQDLLDSQLVERSGHALKLEDTDLVEMTHNVLSMNAVASRRKGITLTFDPKGVYRATVETRSMQRVLDNLISNAVKYSPAGSEVIVRLEHTGEFLRFTVVDHGPGLTEDDKSRVFGKMQRLSARPTGGEASTGLGLYIARAVTEKHHGRIGVNSILGEGSEFWVEIPAHQARAAA